MFLDTNRGFDILSLKQLIDAINSAAQVRNRNRATHNERYIEGVKKLSARNSNSHALFDVISDAIVATKHGRGNKSQQFFGSLVERAVLIGLSIERKETLDAKVTTPEQLLIHCRAITVKLIHLVVLSIVLRGIVAGGVVGRANRTYMTYTTYSLQLTTDY
jgi:hypothetical protein